MPAWNEHWRVKNVPSTAELQVEVLDKNEASLDRSVGKFKTAISPGTKEVTIELGSIRKSPRGKFWLKVWIIKRPNQNKIFIFSQRSIVCQPQMRSPPNFLTYSTDPSDSRSIFHLQSVCSPASTKRGSTAPGKCTSRVCPYFSETPTNIGISITGQHKASSKVLRPSLCGP